MIKKQFKITKKELDSIVNEQLMCRMTADDFGQHERPKLKSIANKYGFDYQDAESSKANPRIILASPITCK